MDISIEIMRRNGVEVDCIRAIDHEIATGVWPDMTEHGWERDEWPAIFERVMAADILVLGMSIWLGEKSSVATQVVERLYGNSHLLNEAGQYAYYGRVGGCLVTGNEDGVKHCAMNDPLLAPAPRLHDPAPGRLRLARRRQHPGPSLRRPGRPAAPRTTSPTATHLRGAGTRCHLARMLRTRRHPAHGNSAPAGTRWRGLIAVRLHSTPVLRTLAAAARPPPPQPPPPQPPPLQPPPVQPPGAAAAAVSVVVAAVPAGAAEAAAAQAQPAASGEGERERAEVR